MNDWKLAGLTRSIWFNQLSRKIYKSLPLPWHVKHRLKEIYLSRPGAWKVRDKSIFQLDRNLEALPSVAASALQFNPADPWVLVVASPVPSSSQDCNSRRMLKILHLLLEMRFQITLVLNSAEHSIHHQEALEKQGVRILHGFDSARSHLILAGGKYHYVLLSGSEVAFRYLPFVRAHALYSKVIYDGGDLHGTGFERKKQVSDGPALLDKITEFRQVQLFNTACTDLVLTANDEEKNGILETQPEAKVIILPNLENGYSYSAARKSMPDIFAGAGDGPHLDQCPDDNSSAISTCSAIISPSSTRIQKARCMNDSKGQVPQGVLRVLIAGIYLADKENLAPKIVAELAASNNWKAEQRWASLGESQPDASLAPFTVQITNSPSPKFRLLNQLLKTVDLYDFEYLIVSDDDILLPAGFLDSYLALVSRHNFALAQPARTHDSYIDHRFVEQLDGIDARRTRFVEIGPLFSLHRSAFEYFLPFDEASPMGWGNDFVWPVVAEKNGLRMGIIDAVPIAHSLRKPVAYYNHKSASQVMNEYLANRPHLSKKDAFFILESYV